MNDQLAAVFERLFNLKELSDETSPDTVEEWDSFSHIELVLELEGEFGVSISTSDAVTLDSVGKIRDYLTSRIAR